MQLCLRLQPKQTLPAWREDNASNLLEMKTACHGVKIDQLSIWRLNHIDQKTRLSRQLAPVSSTSRFTLFSLRELAVASLGLLGKTNWVLSGMFELGMPSNL